MNAIISRRILSAEQELNEAYGATMLGKRTAEKIRYAAVIELKEGIKNQILTTLNTEKGERLVGRALQVFTRLNKGTTSTLLQKFTRITPLSKLKAWWDKEQSIRLCKRAQSSKFGKKVRVAVENYIKAAILSTIYEKSMGE